MRCDPFFAIAAPLLLFATASGAHGQLPSPVPSRTSSADSLAYVRDSTLMDSLSRFVPVDSLRQLYRAVPKSLTPAATVHALQCESFRLWYRYGHAANIAEERLGAQEWTPELRGSVARALESTLRDFRLPTRARCGISDGETRAPERLLYAQRAPWAPKYVAHGSGMEVIRQGATLFEGRLVMPHGRGDTTITLAGSATLQRQTESFVELRLTDRLAKEGRFVALRIAPGTFVYPGSYPIFGYDDVRDVPGAVAVYGRLGRATVGSSHRYEGTLVIERADSLHAVGHVDLVIHRNGLHLFRATMPPDSLRDTIRFSARFRAAYDRDEDRDSRVFAHFPSFPRRYDFRKTFDENETRRGLFLDETVPCSRLPIYLPESTIIPLTSAGRPRQVTALLNILLDSTGAPPRGGVDVLAIDDTAAIRDFRRQAGLRFKRPSPGQPFGRVRCALTIARQ